MNWFKKDKTAVAEDQPVNVTEKLEKLVERQENFAEKALRKAPNFSGYKPRVVLVLDVSYSMQDYYRYGDVQGLIERVLPIGLTLDDNGEVDVFLFHDTCHEIKPVTSQNFAKYIDTEVWPGLKMGGTRYSPVIESIHQKYGVEQKSSTPTFVIFVTDGDCDNNDKPVARKNITKAATANIFWKFLGIGNAGFSFLEELDTMEGRLVDNANFQKMVKWQYMEDDIFYDAILEEVDQWIPEAKKHGILV